MIPGGDVAVAIGVVGVARVTAAGVVGVVIGGTGGEGLVAVVVAGLLLGVVRPACRVKAWGGSKTPKRSVAQVDQAGSILLSPGGSSNCGVHRKVKVER